MKLTEAKLKQMIMEAMDDEQQKIIDNINGMLEDDGAAINQAIELAGLMEIPAEEIAFERMKLINPDNGKVMVTAEELLEIGNTVLEFYEDAIISYLRPKLRRSLERLAQGHEESSSFLAPQSTILFQPAMIIQNELHARRRRKVNVIDASKADK